MALTLHRLAIEIEKHAPRIPNPSKDLEQYTTPGELAAIIAWDALLHYRKELTSTPILDLGCGTGRILLGLLLAGAEAGVCLEADARLVKLAKNSLKRLLKNKEILSIIYLLNKDNKIPLRKNCCSLIASNPPFGVWRRGIDRVFIESALALEPTVFYAILKSGNLNFHRRVSKNYGYRVRLLTTAPFPIPASMKHHKSRIRRVMVDVIAFEG